MHRDYSDAGGYVAIAVFDDRIEIRSSGPLPPGVSVEQLSGASLEAAQSAHRGDPSSYGGR